MHGFQQAAVGIGFEYTGVHLLETLIEGRCCTGLERRVAFDDIFQPSPSLACYVFCSRIVVFGVALLGEHQIRGRVNPLEIRAGPQVSLMCCSFQLSILFR